MGPIQQRGAGVLDEKPAAGVGEGAVVDLLEETRRRDDLRLDLDVVETADGVGENGVGGDAGSEADDARVPRPVREEIGFRLVGKKLLF